MRLDRVSVNPVVAGPAAREQIVRVRVSATPPAWANMVRIASAVTAIEFGNLVRRLALAFVAIKRSLACPVVLALLGAPLIRLLAETCTDDHDATGSAINASITADASRFDKSFVVSTSLPTTWPTYSLRTWVS